MMENSSKGQCECGACGCGNRHMGICVLRWMLGIVILLVVFWMGVQIGSLRAMARYGYSSHRTQNMYYGAMPMQAQGAAMPMVRINGAQPAAGTSATTTTTTRK